MKKIVILLSLILPGCGLFKEAKAALDAAQLMCIMNTDLTDVAAIKSACNVVGDFDEIISQFLITKQFAKRAAECKHH